MGRRVKKAVYDYSAGSWNLEKELLFVYDGWNLVEEITVVGAIETSCYFVWGLDLSQSLQGAGGIGGLIAAVEGSLTYYFSYDGNGNVGQVVNAADGTIAASYQYDPFGNLIKAEGVYADDNPFRFSTKYHDDETGLIYYGYRYYSPELGRWVNRDPIGERGGFNLYVFVLNNSLAIVDPFGLKSSTYIVQPNKLEGPTEAALYSDTEGLIGYIRPATTAEAEHWGLGMDGLMVYYPNEMDEGINPTTLLIIKY
jgi:RHS repeat-associated protein